MRGTAACGCPARCGRQDPRAARVTRIDDSGFGLEKKDAHTHDGEDCSDGKHDLAASAVVVMAKASQKR